VKKYLITAVLLICFVLTYAIGYDLTINKNDGSADDYDTITDAINSMTLPVNLDTDVLKITVYPDFDGLNETPLETVFFDRVYLPGCETELVGYVPDGFDARDYIIIDSYIRGDSYCDGGNAIRVAPGSTNINTYTTINGFTIRRSGNIVGTGGDSGIVGLANNVSIVNCQFGSRSTGNNFCKSVYYITDPTKCGNRMVTILDNIFEEACDLGEYAVFLESNNSSQKTFNAMIKNNSFINCGSGMKVRNSTMFQIEDNTLINTTDLSSSSNSSLVAIWSKSYYNSQFFFSYIENCYIDNFEYGIDAHSSDLVHLIKSNEIFNTSVGITASAYTVFNISRNLIHTKKLSDFPGETIGVNLISKPDYFLLNTIVNADNDPNSIGIKYEAIQPLLVNSCIIWDFDQEINLGGLFFADIQYSCLNDISNQTHITYLDGNIDDDPMFVNPSNNQYKLSWVDEENHSPCIDAGDPDMNNDGTYWWNSEIDQDSDLSPKDMGYFATLHNTIDTRHYEPGWNWVGFPRLTNQSTGIDYFEHVYFNDALSISGLLEEVNDGPCPINDFIEMIGHRGNDITLEYNGLTYTDNGFNNRVYRHEGYKIEVDKSGDPTTIYVDGDRIDPEYIYPTLFNTSDEYWLCYPVTYTQNIVDAFGDFWDKVHWVKSEDWYFVSQNNQRGAVNTPVTTSPDNLSLEYGKTYIVGFSDNVTGFHWSDSGVVSDRTKKSEPTSFTFDEKADYEAIDMINIPASVTEVGVFENGICVGATVVVDSVAQILAYTENVNRNPSQLTFEFCEGRSKSAPISNYRVFNFKSGEFDNKPISGGYQEYSIVRFEEDLSEQNAPVILNLKKNYPNPFNPTTTIEFSLNKSSENLNLEIYNVKGQKVKTLYRGKAEAGTHTFIWNGTDNSNNPVSSGIYFYRLKSDKKLETKKMLLLK